MRCLLDRIDAAVVEPAREYRNKFSRINGKRGALSRQMVTRGKCLQLVDNLIESHTCLLMLNRSNECQMPRGLLWIWRGEACVAALAATSKMRDGSNMAMVELSPRERITAVVRRLLGERSITRTFTVQEELRDVGLTSLDMVNLVLAVESELGVAIPEAEITPANFRSIATIEALVAGLQHRSAA
jgi:acyl carrier protein